MPAGSSDRRLND